MLGTCDTEGELLIIELDIEEVEALRKEFDEIVGNCQNKDKYPHFHEFYNETIVDGFIELAKNKR